MSIFEKLEEGGNRNSLQHLQGLSTLSSYHFYREDEILSNFSSTKGWSCQFFFFFSFSSRKLLEILIFTSYQLIITPLLTSVLILAERL